MVKLKMLFRWILLLSHRQCVEGWLWGGPYSFDEPDKYEMEHYGYFPVEKYYSSGTTTTTPSPWVDRTYKIPDTKMLSPDFRVPERLPTPKPLWGAGTTSFKQYNRPYRFSASAYIAYYYGHAYLPRFFKPDEADHFACYCSTAYFKSIPLAGCALLTTRHVLTTASSTERVLKDHGHQETLENILGVWYEKGFVKYGNNVSIYATPARIHYHPWYTGLDRVNMSHPVPMYDLSVWALTIPTYSWYPYDKKGYRAVFCQRPSSHEFYQTSPGLRQYEDYWVFGYQLIRAYNRKPNPTIKYGIRTRDIVYPCAKKEWGWFLCIGGRWAPLGLDSGAPLHRSTVIHQRGWLEVPDLSGWKFWDRTSTPKPIVRVDGLIGLAAFSLNLRSNKLVHYFTVTETHHVLDFLYSAYMGRLPYAYLDIRFYDTQWGAPYPKPWAKDQFSFGANDYPVPVYSNKLPYPGDNTLL